MADTQTLQPVDAGSDSAVGEYIANASRTDGSRTPIWKIARCHQLKREGRSVNAISEILGMDDRTVKAVLARQDHLIADARMLLSANVLGFAGDLIQASQEAAKRGKTEGIAAVLDRLGVTEPPKSQAQTSVGVQVILHGGGVPSELSLAKHESGSESLAIQAGNSVGLITQLMETSQAVDATSLTSDGVQTVAQAQDTDKVLEAVQAVDATNVAEIRK